MERETEAQIDLDNNNGFNKYGEEVKFKNYFSFDDEHDIKIYPGTARITFNFLLPSCADAECLFHNHHWVIQQ